MQNELIMTNDRLGRIVEDSASEAYVFSVTDFKFILVNRGARENLGFTMDELQTRTPWDIKPEMSRETFLEAVNPLVTGEKPNLIFETVHERKDGSRYNVAVHLQLISSDGDDIFYAAIQDVTEQKKTEAALKDVSARLDAILDNTNMAIFMMDEKQLCVFMNKAAETLTGYTFEEAEGRQLHDVVHHTHPDGRQFLIEDCSIDRAFPENHQLKGEEVFVHKNGSFYPIGYTASPMKDGQGRTVGTVVEARDLTDELKARNAEIAFNEALKSKVAEAMTERDKLEAQLVQAQKMEAVGQLTGGVAHDFNNLLQVIAGNLQLLLKDLPENDPKQTRVHNALAGVNRGAKLTAQLLAFGRQQSLEPKPSNVGRLVRSMDDMLRRTLGEAIEIETVISGGLWNCFADPAQVENVILNLAINARDAMDHQGKLTIEAGNAALDEIYANDHPDVTVGQYVMLAVSDTGSGIPVAIIEKVFDPFFTTKAIGEGTGLGLSMVYGFVKQTGGHIKIYSEDGQGTTVRIYLPRSREDEKIEQMPSSRLTEVGQGEVILIVEDDTAVRETAVDVLRDLGYSVLMADNADSAMAIVNSGVKIDLLFTDVVMPGTLRSPELARKAKDRLPGLGVLFTSGYTQNSIVHAGRLDEGVELLSKPYTRERLAQKIREILDRHQSHPSQHTFDQNEGLAVASETQDELAGPMMRVLLVEDEVLIRMATTDMLVDMGYEVVEAGKISEAKELLKNETFHIMITDLGLPDGSGIDLVRVVLAEYPLVAVIVASGTDPRDYPEDEKMRSKLVSLRKPFDQSALSSALSLCFAV